MLAASIDPRGRHPAAPVAAWAPKVLIVYACLCSGGMLGWGARGVVQAAEGSRTVVPSLRRAAVSGVQLVVDTRWAAGTGLRPIRVRVRTANGLPSKYRRVFRVHLTPNHYYRESRLEHIGYVELAKGAIVADAVIPIRQETTIRNVSLQVFEGNERLREMNANLHCGNGSYERFSEVFPTLLFIDSRAPSRDLHDDVLRGNKLGQQYLKAVDKITDVRGILELIPHSRIHSRTSNRKRTLAQSQGIRRSSRSNAQFIKRIRINAILRTLGNSTCADLLPLPDLPEKWTEYSSFDLVFVRFEDVDDLVSQHPERWRALLRWIHTGATLYVSGVGAQGEKLPELDGFLNQGSLGGTPTAAAEAEWRPSIVLKSGGIETMYRGGRRAMRSGTGVAPTRPSEFLQNRALGFGRVIAIQRDDPEELTYGERADLLNAAELDNFSWQRRSGISMHKANDSYWRHLIPGFGMPPVNTFLICSTLFVIVLGPINYFLLRRSKRLYLLLVTIPAAAVLVIAVLVGYAIVVDGFGVRLRSRAVTYVDGSGGAVSVSHQTYYAAKTPGNGLSFPADAVVFPVLHTPRERRRGSRKELVWTDGRQYYRAGYMKPRSMTQFLVVSAGPADMRLVVSGPPSAATVENQLRTDVQLLVVRQRDGEFFVARNLSPGATAKLEKIDRQSLKTALRKIDDAHQPNYPEGFDQASFTQMQRSRVYYSPPVDHNFGPPNFRRGVLERTVRSCLTRHEKTLRPGDFLAVTVASPAPPNGAEGAQREGGLELILGKWVNP